MMRPSPRNLALLAGGGSAALLAAALFFQSIGYAPCELCILQRWPHLAAAVIAVAIAATGFRRIWGVLGLVAAVLATAFAIHHVGVEQAWWAGPSACSGGLGDLSAVTPQELLARIQGAPVVRCDEPSWHFLGLTMAAWNAILSGALVVVWAMALRRSNR
ncbi:disulfide bond formation protein B [Paracoccus sp. (in: a-proteobacteria)]|uniref:disulfide bond formation protein B n=1 Tax=Paracoccus sp. TaxID=267 RepID=UPI0026E0B352|nr:disulfide bond formation protein B [Paracoccus sp. (in: a-proteobacteria)]MDO5369336.1 disulfide bond formation protein B [Paracoccus sp. (in: a-proteobacteria)]